MPRSILARFSGTDEIPAPSLTKASAVFRFLIVRATVMVDTEEDKTEGSGDEFAESDKVGDGDSMCSAFDGLLG